MKLLYISSVDYPSRLANRIQTIEMARQFSRLLSDFIFGAHNIQNVDDISHVENFGGSTKSFILGFRYARFIRKHGITHIFSREEKLLFFTLFFSRLFSPSLKVTFEAHSLPEKNSFFWNSVIGRSDCIIVLTSLAKSDLMKSGMNGSKILVAPDGVDMSLFDNIPKKEEARKKLSLPPNERIILYTGHLYDWKGVETLASAADKLSFGSRIYFLGGTDRDIRSFKEKNKDKKNITIVGHVEHSQVPLWLSASDVLVLPNSSKEKISSRYTSPLKLFEYMASRRPIVASDLPSIRDVLNDGNAMFFEADNSASLAYSIEKVLSNMEESERKAEKSYEASHLYTWEKRAKNILDFIQ